MSSHESDSVLKGSRACHHPDRVGSSGRVHPGAVCSIHPRAQRSRAGSPSTSMISCAAQAHDGALAELPARSG